MPPNLAHCWALLKGVTQAWLDDYVPSMGAALAYYTLFSLAPLLLIVISVAGLVFGQEAARGEIAIQLRALMGESGAGAVQALLVSVDRPSQGIAATLVGVLLLLVGATTVFGELQDSLDRIWRVPARNQSNGWIALLRARLLSFWHDSGHWLLADGVAAVKRGTGWHGALVESAVWRLAGGGQCHPGHCWLFSGGGDVCSDLQGDATGAGTVERCLDWCGVHLTAVHLGQGLNRGLHWSQ